MRNQSKLKPERRAILLFVFLFCFSTFSFSATYTSTAAGGNWSAGATWVGGVAPPTGTANDVVIATTGLGAVTLTGNWACRSLTVNANSLLTITGGAVVLTVNASFVVPASTNNGTINGTGKLSVGVWSGGFTNSSTGVVSLASYASTLVTTNNGSFSTTTDINCGGNFSNTASTAVLYIGGTSTFSASLLSTTSSSTVNYNGAAQNIKGGGAASYANLTLSGSGTKTLVTGNATIGENLVISGTASFNPSTNNFDVSVGSNWTVTSTAADPFVQGTRTVTFNGSGYQNLSTVLAGGETFYNLVINSVGDVVQVSATDVTVTNTLTMTKGLWNINGRTFTLGASGAASTLTYTAGWFYGGTLKRYWPTGTTITAANYGLFPMGTQNASTYRPIQITSSANITASVFFTVNHVDATTVTDFSAVNDGGTNITRKSDAQFLTTLSAGTGAATYTVTATMTGLAPGTASDIRLAKNSGATVVVVGAYVANTGTAQTPVVSRTGITSAQLLTNIDFRVVSTNPGATPLRNIFYSRNGGGNWNAAATWSTVGCGGGSRHFHSRCYG